MMPSCYLATVITMQGSGSLPGPVFRHAHTHSRTQGPARHKDSCVYWAGIRMHRKKGSGAKTSGLRIRRSEFRSPMLMAVCRVPLQRFFPTPGLSFPICVAGWCDFLPASQLKFFCTIKDLGLGILGNIWNGASFYSYGPVVFVCMQRGAKAVAEAT